MKAHPVHHRVSGGLEQLPSLLRIMQVLRYIRVIRPAFGRKNTGGETHRITPEVLDQRLAVEGISNRLSYAHIFQNGIAEIESHICQPRARTPHDPEGGLVLEGELHVRSESAALQVSAAFADLECTGGGIGYNRKTHSLELRLLTPVII